YAIHILRRSLSASVRRLRLRLSSFICDTAWIGSLKWYSSESEYRKDESVSGTRAGQTGDGMAMVRSRELLRKIGIVEVRWLARASAPKCTPFGSGAPLPAVYFSTWRATASQPSACPSHSATY